MPRPGRWLGLLALIVVWLDSAAGIRLPVARPIPFPKPRHALRQLRLPPSRGSPPCAGLLDFLSGRSAPDHGRKTLQSSLVLYPGSGARTARLAVPRTACVLVSFKKP